MKVPSLFFQGCLLCSAVAAQSAKSAFQAADIHPSKGKVTSRANLLPGGRYQIRNTSLLGLIRTAWGVDTEIVYGGPPWLADDRFDVTALAPAGATLAECALMLRGLLAERFGLVTHDDRKPLQVFALLQAKRGAQLKRSAGEGPASCLQDYDPGPPLLISYTCQNTTMAAFAAGLRPIDSSITRPVADRTELAGAWDFTIRFTPLFQLQTATAAGQPSPGIKLFDALDKIGLRLELQPQVVPVLAVDRVNRAPAANPPGTEERLPPAPVEFEVGEIKPSAPGVQDQHGEISPSGRVDLRGLTLKQLIQTTWHVENDRISGGPKWLDSDHFDVVAKAPPSTPVEDLLPMLKNLVIDQFQLATHTADLPVTVFFLTAGKNPKLKDADPAARSECAISRGQAGKGADAVPLKVYTCHNMTMAKFAGMIRTQAAGYLKNPVIDQTGLKGAYDFTLSWTRNDVANATQSRRSEEGSAIDPTGSISIFDAVEHQLGLKLEGGKRYPLPVLVIDHAEAITEAR